MSRVLFLCSGNTCRSPMAAGFARRVFGGSHSILSAGAETENGMPAAKTAITVMSEMGIDISSHLSFDVVGLQLTSFDLIVVFRPSVAESISFPVGVCVEYLDVPDPYGGTIETYRTAARSIQLGVRRLYVEDALRRTLSADKPAGSHLSGILNRAAKECEKEIEEFVQQLGVLVHEKATLGQLANYLGEYAASNSIPELAKLSAAVAAANDVWVEVKHREDPPEEDLIAGVRAIHKVFQLLEERTT